MSYSTLLDIVQRAADELAGVTRPTVVVASSDPIARQLYAHANAAGRDLMRLHEWTALHTTTTIATVNGTSTYSLASDYDRMIVDTLWNRTNKQIGIGPDSPVINRFLNESGTASVGIHPRFRLAGTSLVIWPTPTSVQTLVYEYASNKWARSSLSVAQIEFLTDTDTSVFDPDLLKAEIKWRYMAGKGFYADALKDEAMAMRDLKIAGDIGGTVLDMGPDNDDDRFIGLDNVKDASWSL